MTSGEAPSEYRLQNIAFTISQAKARWKWLLDEYLPEGHMATLLRPGDVEDDIAMFVSADTYDSLLEQLRLLNSHDLLPDTLIEPAVMWVSPDEARRRLSRLVEDLEMDDQIARLGDQAVLAPSDIYLHLLQLRQFGLMALQERRFSKN